MAKKDEYDLTPLEVAQVATRRNDEFHPWATAIARNILLTNLGENFRKNKPLEFEKLLNSIANHLIIAKNGS